MVGCKGETENRAQTGGRKNEDVVTWEAALMNLRLILCVSNIHYQRLGVPAPAAAWRKDAVIDTRNHNDIGAA